MNSYQKFLKGKGGRMESYGFDPLWMPDFFYDFQSHLSDWTIRQGRGAMFADCGLGKTPLSLVWGENVVRKTNKPVLILTPLAVAPQFVREGEKFGVEVNYTRDGSVKKGINVVNYDRLHYFNHSDFAGVVCDESGILKHHDAKTRQDVTDFASNGTMIHGHAFTKSLVITFLTIANTSSRSDRTTSNKIESCT